MRLEKSFFRKMTEREFEFWLATQRLALAGGAIFTKNKSLVSKLVAKFERGAKNEFVPSHIGSLVLLGGQIYIFNMKPPKAKLTPLASYLENTREDFIVLTRDFELDVEKFSFDICSRVNQKYGYLSALQSAFDFLWYPFREHCSEIHLKELQRQGLFMGKNPNKVTPLELLHILLA